MLLLFFSVQFLNSINSSVGRLERPQKEKKQTNDDGFNQEKGVETD